MPDSNQESPARAAIVMEIPSGWHEGPSRDMLDAFQRQYGRVALAMHDLHPDVRMSFERTARAEKDNQENSAR